MWSTRACRRTLKAGAGMGVGLTAAAAAQGLYLNSLYKPLPEAMRAEVQKRPKFSRLRRAGGPSAGPAGYPLVMPVAAAA